MAQVKLGMSPWKIFNRLQRHGVYSGEAGVEFAEKGEILWEEKLRLVRRVEAKMKEEIRAARGLSRL